MHLTPRVEFFWPIAWEKTKAELADLLTEPTTTKPANSVE
jgi:hypothetical protein